MYKKLEQNPVLVLDLYDYINSSNTGDYCIFLDMLSKLFASTERRSRMSLRIPYGKDYALDSDLFFDARSGTVNIKVTKVSYTPLPKPPGLPPGVDIPRRIASYSTIVDEPKLHPLDMVALYNADTNETQYVPAIYVKYLSDKASWAEIVEWITIALDVIVIIASAGTLAAGATGLAFVVAAVDIGFAATDLLLKIEGVRALLSETTAGKWLVDHWNEIYMVQGTLVLGPQLIRGIVEHGPVAIGALIKAGTAAAAEFAEIIERLLLRVKVELYISAIGKTTNLTFSASVIVAKFLGNAIAKKMKAIGLTLWEATGTGMYTVMYNGTKIAEGDIKSVRKLITEIFEKKGDDLVRYLEELVYLKSMLRFLNRFEEHTKFGHIKIKVIDSRLPKGKNIAQEYEYVLGKGGQMIKAPYSASYAVGGGHMLKELNNKFIRIVENLGTKKLPTGETVRICKVQYWVEELGQWVSKKDKHTFWPSGWDMKKIKEVCEEAAKDIFFPER